MDVTEIPTNAPSSCPGTSSLTAGKATGCQGCPNQGACASGTGALNVQAVAGKIFSQLEHVKRLLIVMSGKGGVGKSSVACLIASGLSETDRSRRVGVLDMDITGPSVPIMLGCDGEAVHQSGSGWAPVAVSEGLCVMSVAMVLTSADQALVWRGPKKIDFIQKMLTNVDWNEGGALDYLVIDTPPGTMDEHLSLVQLLQAADPSGGLFRRVRVVIVTTPQEVALADVRRQIAFCQRMKLPILGVVGNMCRYRCSQCRHEFETLPATTGGVAELCRQYELACLAELPLDPGVTWCLDHGVSVFSDEDEVAEFGDEDRVKRPSDTSLAAIELMVGAIVLAMSDDNVTD